MNVISKSAFGLALALGIAPQAQAALLIQAPDTSNPSIIQVFAGCGPYGHRGPYGGCRPGGQWGGYIRGRSCPPGFHLGPYGRRCWPN